MADGKAQDKKKQDKKNYLRDYKENPDGSYVYTGKTWSADKAARRRLLIKLWTLQIVMLSAAVLPGFVTTAGLLNTFYVIIPYVFWLMSDFVLAYTLGSMTLGGNPLKDYIYEKSVLRYPFRVMLPLAGAALTALGLIVFLLRGGKGEGKAVCFVCCIIQIIASFLAGRSGISDIWED
ncbi:MAG: hypothetical protein NC321_04105 [Clostridium sp.]|nr:hypothetical protein [Clostridium sp.]